MTETRTIRQDAEGVHIIFDDDAYRPIRRGTQHAKGDKVTITQDERLRSLDRIKVGTETWVLS